jgi:WD domain, G-beta repeat
MPSRAEYSHPPTRQRERRMRGFKSPAHAQRFRAAYGPIAQHFRPQRHLLPYFEQQAEVGSLLYYPFDTHWNAEGIQAAAEYIWKEWALSLRDRGAIGPTFSSDGRWIMARSPGTALVWDVSSGKELASLPTFSGWAAFDRRDRILLVERTLRSPQVGTLETTSVPHAIPVVRLPHAVVGESRDGKLVLTATDSFSGVVWDSASWKEVSIVKGHYGPVTGAVFDHNSRWVMTVSEDGDRGARVWDSSTARKIAEVGLEYMQGAAFSPDSRRIATLSSDGTVRFFEWERFAPVEQLVALETMAMLFISEEIGWQRQPTPGQHGHHTLLTQLIVPEPGMGRRRGPVVRREHLGGLLSYYHREAA